MLLTYGKKSSYMWKGKTGVWADQHCVEMVNEFER